MLIKILLRPELEFLIPSQSRIFYTERCQSISFCWISSENINNWFLFQILSSALMFFLFLFEFCFHAFFNCFLRLLSPYLNFRTLLICLISLILAMFHSDFIFLSSITVISDSFFNYFTDWNFLLSLACNSFIRFSSSTEFSALLRKFRLIENNDIIEKRKFNN